MKVKELILSIDLGPNPLTRYDYEDCDSDVIVLIEEEDEHGKLWEKRYVAPFFTFKNIQKLSYRGKNKSQFLGGKYFWAEGMVLIDKLELGDVKKVVNDIIDEGDFLSVFRQI